MRNRSRLHRCRLLLATALLLAASFACVLPTTAPQKTATLPPPTATPTVPATPSPTPPALPEGWIVPKPLPPGPLALSDWRMVDAQHGWAVGTTDEGAGARLLITDDGARTWREVPLPQPRQGAEAISAFFLDDENAWVAFDLPSADDPASTGVWATHDRGATWHWAPLPLSQDERGGLFSPGPWAATDAAHIWLMITLDVGMHQALTTLKLSTDGGDTWQSVGEPFTALSNTSGFAIGPEGRYGWITKGYSPMDRPVLLISRDGGRRWEEHQLALPTEEALFCATAAPNLRAEGNGLFLITCRLPADDAPRYGVWIAHWEDDRLVRLEAPPGISALVGDGGRASLVFVSPTEGYLALPTAEGTAIYATADGGDHWTQVSRVDWQGDDFQWLPGGRGWASRLREGDIAHLMQTEDGGHSWEKLPPPVLAAAP